jgi:hypothetical protein
MKVKFFVVVKILLFCFWACGVYKRPVKTYATNISYGYSHNVRQFESRWEFYDYNGKRCDDITSLEGESNDVVGEKFVLIYDSLHPRRYPLIDFSKPVFLPNEITEKTTCIIEYPIVISHKKKYIRFQYYVNGKGEYRGTQLVLPKKDSTLDFKKGDRFEGESWKNNPRRVIIYIDKPVKGSEGKHHH